MKNEKLKILDCTLRDGGYYNNWDFDNELVEIYLKSMRDASIDVVEIGFRSPPKNSFMGPYVYSLDEHLESLPLPKNILIGVMINANEYLSAPEGPVEMINKLFQPRDKSPVGLVRIAINFDSVLIPAEGRLSEKFTRLKSSHVSNKNNKKKNNNAENHSGFGQNGTG